ncbi:hypothetical protein IXB50_01830 [Leptothoe spongobia TAU-MAC 1115]|uniref:Winged helix domain-containing protein n=1 Tax=Leptothoe spongobia TAU-MAC 1115 TaxID=1967444 RepID=A0A947DBI4_9CYAN|nr:hypothetical protein [Leptothoe spongobia]MBT9314161.1 hypothetical protein [Leptothoe spongobia TAU-MAC 1115]
MSVSQQRKNLKSVTRVAKTSADQATSDWWQGLIAIKNRAYDDVAPKKTSEGPSLGYQKTLDKRILLSRASKVSLGLPTMQMVLGLSLFEKKLVLMTLAPEVQMRYGKLYHYLQTGTHCATGSLPTLDLALRVLCRNEAERRQARVRLSGPKSLLKRQILHRADSAPTLLGSQLQLASEWVEYLLAENPDPVWPMQFLMADRFSHRCRQRMMWSQLILANELKQQLQGVTAQAQSRLLLVGEKGVGKERVAIALSTHLQHPLHILDLDQVSPQAWSNCLSELTKANYAMVLVKSAHHWLGRNSTVERAPLQHWLTTSSAHILFSVRHRHLVRHHWRQQVTVLDIPMPDADLRLQLWQQSFPESVKGMGKVRWTALAESLPLSYNQILEIGQMTKTLAGDEAITIDHLQQVLTQQGQDWKLR